MFGRIQNTPQALRSPILKEIFFNATAKSVFCFSKKKEKLNFKKQINAPQIFFKLETFC